MSAIIPESMSLRDILKPTGYTIEDESKLDQSAAAIIEGGGPGPGPGPDPDPDPGTIDTDDLIGALVAPTVTVQELINAPKGTLAWFFVFTSSTGASAVKNIYNLEKVDSEGDSLADWVSPTSSTTRVTVLTDNSIFAKENNAQVYPLKTAGTSATLRFMILRQGTWS